MRPPWWISNMKIDRTNPDRTVARFTMTVAVWPLYLLKCFRAIFGPFLSAFLGESGYARITCFLLNLIAHHVYHVSNTYGVKSSA